MPMSQKPSIALPDEVFSTLEHKQQIEAHLEGYRKHPETPDEIETADALSVELFERSATSELP